MDELRFPMFISLKNKKIIIFGGGNVALRRIDTMLLFMADIIVVAPSFNKEITEQYKDKIKIINDNYNEKYLTEDIYIVLAATNDEVVNELIYNKCREHNILVNNASNKEQCDFYFPAVIASSDAVIGITGNGSNHKRISSLTKKIREFLNSN